MPKSKKADVLTLTDRDALNYVALVRAIMDVKSPMANIRLKHDSITKSQRLRLLQDQHYCCAECGKEFGKFPDNPTQDHIIPHRYGGQANLHNIEMVCEPCNHWRDHNFHLGIVEKRFGPIDMSMIVPIADFCEDK